MALNAPPPRLDTRAAAGHITVLPATIWALKEQTSSRAFVRKLRSFLRTREVAILDPGDVEAPDAAYIFLVDEARDIVPHLLTGRDTHWTDLNTGIGFEYSDEGFRYETEAGGFEAIGLQAYWVEPVQNGVTQNRRRLGW